MQAVILAAGKGSRLNPITLNRTKAMVPILGKPIVERVMESLAQNGIEDFILVVSREDNEVTRYFQEQSTLKVKLQFVVQPERLGMANALSLAAPYLHNSFILSACDNLTPTEHVADLLETHHQQGANATLSLMQIDRAQSSRTGIIEWQDGQHWLRWSDGRASIELQAQAAGTWTVDGDVLSIVGAAPGSLELLRMPAA